MADMIGGIELKAAGLIAASANQTAVEVGKCAFTIRLAWTAAEIASNDELYLIFVEANTEAATTTWTRLGIVAALGATEVLATSGDSAATGEIIASFRNPYDYQIRLATYVSGAIATGLNYSAKLFPQNNVLIG